MEIFPLNSIPKIEMYKLKYFIYLFLTIMVIGCKGDVELALERGIQYYEWNMMEKAALEFKFVIHTLAGQNSTLKYKQIKLLSRAHHNLAVAYAKKTWYSDAVAEAQKAFELIPTDDNRKVLELIQKKQSGESINSNGIKPSSR